MNFQFCVTSKVSLAGGNEGGWQTDHSRFLGERAGKCALVAAGRLAGPAHPDPPATKFQVAQAATCNAEAVALWPV